MASEDSVKKFNYLVSSWWRSTIFDSHIWLSIWHRPHRSNFTRAQRLTVYTTALYLTMLASAMWYRGDVDEDESVLTLKLGAFVITYYQVYASVLSCATVFPVIFVTKKLFVHISSMSKTVGEAVTEKKVCTRRNGVNCSTYMEMEMVETWRHGDDGNTMSREHDKGKTGMKQSCLKGDRKLHRVCIYIGWMMCTASCVAAGFLTIMYSLHWGGDKANRWMSTFFLSVAEDISFISTGQVSTKYNCRNLILFKACY